MPDSFTVLRCTECGATKDGLGWSDACVWSSPGHQDETAVVAEEVPVVALDDVVETLRWAEPEITQEAVEGAIAVIERKFNV